MLIGDDDNNSIVDIAINNSSYCYTPAFFCIGIYKV